MVKLRDFAVDLVDGKVLTVDVVGAVDVGGGGVDVIGTVGVVLRAVGLIVLGALVIRVEGVETSTGMYTSSSS